MSTVVSVLDRESWNANTDNIVVADPAHNRLLWVPRDLWCPRLGDRINRAFAIGGATCLAEALEEHGIRAQHGLCLSRAAVEAALADVRVTVPVPARMAFWYPLAPQLRLQDGRKMVVFEPPFETLHGERLHQWIGARRRVQEDAATPGRGLWSRIRFSRRRPPALPDLDRIQRQQVLVRALLSCGFDFAPVVADPARYSATGDGVWAELGRVRADWSLETFGPLEPRTVDGKEVLVRRQR